MLTQTLKLIVITVLTLSSATFSTFAEDCPSSVPRNFTSEQLQSCMDEISVLRDQIANITSRLDSLTNTSLVPTSIPAGGVMAFDLQGGCPIGWKAYTHANGRTIVGAINSGTASNPNLKHAVKDKRLYHYNERHGEERVTLTDNEIPSHSHALHYVTIIADGLKLADAGAGTNIPYFSQSNLKLSETNNGVKAAGGSSSHNNMPPYVALYFCKKTGE